MGRGLSSRLEEALELDFEVGLVDIALDELAEERLERMLDCVLVLVLLDLQVPLRLLLRLARVDEVLQQNCYAHLPRAPSTVKAELAWSGKGKPQIV